MHVTKQSPGEDSAGAADFVNALARADDSGENIPENREFQAVKLIAPRSGNSEESDDYSAVVATLNTGWRIIVCRDGIQWILQRRAGKRHGQTRWDSRSYCRSRQGLAARVHGLAVELDANALAILEGLPDWIGGRP